MKVPLRPLCVSFFLLAACGGDESAPAAPAGGGEASDPAAEVGEIPSQESLDAAAAAEIDEENADEAFEDLKGEIEGDR